MSKRPPPVEKASRNAVPEHIMGYVSVKGSASIFDRRSRQIPENSAPFHATRAKRREAAKQLDKMKLSIMAESALGFAVAGSPDAFEELTGGKVRTRERRLPPARRGPRYVTHVDIHGPNQPPELGIGRARSPRLGIDGIVLDRPRRLHAVSDVPPDVPGFYLNVPDDVAAELNAGGAHRQGFLGQGVHVAMPDTGMFLHPYYAAQRCQVLPPGSIVPDLPGEEDPSGHGTGECANIFAIAPACEVQPIRCSDASGVLVAGMAGIIAAKAARAHVISISFGGTLQIPPTPEPPTESLALALELQDAVESGIVVVAAAGDGQFSIEPQIPGVISVGGVFVDRDGSRFVSDIASAFASPWFLGINVPLVCGLCGNFPDFYLMLPVPPNSQMDDEQANFDPNDGTAGDDGWARFSGTSAAAPQIAGAAAVLLSAKPGLTPAQVEQALCAKARDVTRGTSSLMFHVSAGPGQDSATGFGLVDVSAALKFAQDNF